MASRRSNYQASHIFDQPDTQAKNISQNLEPKTYYSYSHTSPYVDGKKNSQYVHPSLISNQVFYNQDEGQKRPATSANQEYNRNKTEESYRNQDNRPVTAGQKGRRESNRENYDYGHEEADKYKSGTGGREDQRYYERDDRSESSTLSSAGYLCPNCLNRHIYEDQRNACKRQREEDMERERRIADANNRIAREQEEQERYSRNKRVTQSRELKDQLDQNYNTKLENRRSPKRESASAFNNIFEKQDELVEKNRDKNQEFRSSLQDQMYQSSMKKNQEKQANLSPYGTSLQIGEGYHNKYIEGASNNIKEALKDQAEEKSQKQRREREAERRLAQETGEQALREQEEEERRRREQDWRQKNQLKDHLLRTIEDNRSRKHEEVASKVNERTLVDQKYLDYKRKQAEEEEKAKRQLFDYGRALHNQQEHSSYKKQYDERRNQKESTSFDPSPTKSRKLYPCGECNVPYERSHLTKHH